MQQNVPMQAMQGMPMQGIQGMGMQGLQQNKFLPIQPNNQQILAQQKGNTASRRFSFFKFEFCLFIFFSTH